MMVSVLICSYGGSEWEESAWTVAYPSAIGQGACEVIVHHEPEGSLSSTRNNAAEKACGDWLLFLDADDEIAPGFIDAMRRSHSLIHESNDEVLLTPAVTYVRGRTRPVPKIWPKLDLRLGNYLVIGTLVPRSLFLHVGGFRDFGLYEDYDLFARCWIAGAEVVEVPQAVYIAHSRPGSRNRAPHRKAKLFWHQSIGHSNWPDLYDAPSPDEIERASLCGSRLRFTQNPPP